MANKLARAANSNDLQLPNLLYARANPNVSGVPSNTLSNPMDTGTGSGGEGGGYAVDIATLKEKVSGHRNWLALLTTLFGIAFIFFLDRLDDRFDKVDQPLRAVQQSVAVQGATVSEINGKLDAIVAKGEMRDGNHPKSGAQGK